MITCPLNEWKLINRHIITHQWPHIYPTDDVDHFLIVMISLLVHDVCEKSMTVLQETMKFPQFVMSFPMFSRSCVPMEIYNILQVSTASTSLQWLTTILQHFPGFADGHLNLSQRPQKVQKFFLMVFSPDLQSISCPGHQASYKTCCSYMRSSSSFTAILVLINK